MARLAAVERDGATGLCCAAADGAGCTVDAAGDIDREDTAGSRQGLGNQAVHVAGQAGAEHGVDHEIGARRLERTEESHWPRPVGGGDGGIRSGPGWGKRSEADGNALCREEAGRNITVPAVIAWPA